jgi:hypothetical protein
VPAAEPHGAHAGQSGWLARQAVWCDRQLAAFTGFHPCNQQSHPQPEQGQPTTYPDITGCTSSSHQRPPAAAAASDTFESAQNSSTNEFITYVPSAQVSDPQELQDRPPLRPGTQVGRKGGRSFDDSAVHSCGSSGSHTSCVGAIRPELLWSVRERGQCVAPAYYYYRFGVHQRWRP